MSLREKKSLMLVLLARLSLIVSLKSSNFVGGISENDTETAVTVTRRVKDTYILLQGGELACNTALNVTYLVHDDECITNQDLFNECPFALAAMSELNTSRLVLNIRMDDTVTSGETINLNSQITTAVVVLQITERKINSPACHISSLEVYRGREATSAYQIRQDGFSLGTNGTIEVRRDELYYVLDEYVGELYRMSLSCSGEGLPQNGCLFFKVIGQTNITETKFNCSVPGTVPSNSSECETDVNTTESPTRPATTDTMATTEQPTTTDTSTSEGGPPPSETSSLYYGIVGGGAGVILLLCVISAITVVFVIRKRECKCGSRPAQPQLYEEVQLSTATIKKELGDYDDILSEKERRSLTLEAPQYAEVGATYQEIMPRSDDPIIEIRFSTLDEGESQEDKPPHEYNTLTQVGDRNGLKLQSPPRQATAPGAGGEQYAQLMRPGNYYVAHYYTPK